MGKKKKKRLAEQAALTPAQPESSRNHPWIYGLAILVFLAAGLLAKAMVFSDAERVETEPAAVHGQLAPMDNPLEEQVRLVSSEFRCACGGCGELPLVDCTCDMPRGAQEEKAFIRKHLLDGMPASEVMDHLESTYGHRNA